MRAMQRTHTEPSNRELRDALHRCRILRSRASMAALRHMRESRVTWCNTDELALRAEVDKLLRGDAE